MVGSDKEVGSQDYGSVRRPKSDEVDCQAGDPGKSHWCSSSPNAVCWQNSFLLEGGQSLLNRLDESHPSYRG